LGFPLARHIRRRQTRRWHRRLACHGPNDGATILADACDLPGLIFPVWGADHYLDAVYSPEQLLSALLRYLAASASESTCESTRTHLALGRDSARSVASG
jgi:hypothetical protein